MLGTHVYMGGRVELIAVTFPLDSASLAHCTLYGIRRSLHNMTATNTKGGCCCAAAASKRHHGFVLLCVLRSLQPLPSFDLSSRHRLCCCSTLLRRTTVTSRQRIRGYFYNEMRYINLRFTYLLTYLLWTRL